MTTAEHFRDTVPRPGATVLIAGVAWPAFKVISLLVGLLVFVAVGLTTVDMAPAVLSASAVAVVTWLTLGRVARFR